MVRLDITTIYYHQVIIVVFNNEVIKIMPTEVYRQLTEPDFILFQILKQQHPGSVISSEGSRNLQQLWSLRLGRGAGLTAAKQLQVFPVRTKESK